jgi:hypothetical protein
MTGVANHESEKPERIPPLGTPQYQEYVERQGQAALDAALAHPITRIFFGLLLLCFAIALAALIMESVERYPVWMAAVTVFGMSVAILPIIIETGSVAIFGKSRTSWLRALMRRNYVHRLK